MVSLFNKVAGLKACNFIKKRLQHRCFPVKFAKFFRTSFFYRKSLVAASLGIYVFSIITDFKIRINNLIC